MTYLTKDTTEQIITVSVTEIDGITELTVSAMDVYRLVNPKNTKFLSWINRHFKFLVFVDGKDFVSVPRNAEAEHISDDYGDTDYYIKLHTAKALVLLSGCKANDPVIKYLNNYSVNVRNTEYEKRRLFDATGLMSIWFIKRVWHWLDYKPAVSGDVPEDLESMLFTRTERELSLVNELRNAIKERFADSVSEYEVNQFIEGWQPAAFPEILDEI